ncbi:MAG: energy transducer TonB [Pyrinomonadaceae bacterium]
MNANHSATRIREYRPTIIENRLLVSRLVIEGITSLMLTALAIGLWSYTPPLRPPATGDEGVDMVLLDLAPPIVDPGGGSKNTLSGSGPTRQSSRGGGSGGDRDPAPQQTGKVPPPSPIPAAIPITPPVTPPALPVAGVDLDPALWKDLKAPVYGDPRSTSNIPSKGPGEGEGIGSYRGTGIGDGDGPGVGPGKDGNTGGGFRQIGCCGGPAGEGRDGIFRGSEVDQRARLLAKPEPQYTEDARKNQISGTVMLRAVFSSSGEVVQIRALNTLPFGLTERAIAAARRIRFVPAIKDGRPVSVYMQLEYNFNLY